MTMSPSEVSSSGRSSIRDQLYPGISFAEGSFIPQTKFQFVEVRTKLSQRLHIHPMVVFIDHRGEEHLIQKTPLLSEIAV